MSSTTDASAGRAQISARTLRTDRWWLPPLLTFAGLTAWVAYATVRAFMQSDYFVEQYNYLTPFYSPCVSRAACPRPRTSASSCPTCSWLPVRGADAAVPAAVPADLLLLPQGLLPGVLAVAAGLRGGRAARQYTGETRFPLIGQNLHRYFFYAAVIISVINTYDAIYAFVRTDGEFGFGLGNVILLVNVVLLWAYTLSCHSCRSIIGGRLNHFSKHPVRYKCWQFVCRLNTKHMQLAWITLGTLALTDFYIMAVAAGWISDLRIIN